MAGFDWYNCICGIDMGRAGLARPFLLVSEGKGSGFGGILLEGGMCWWDNIVKQIGIEKMRCYYEEE
ncbi:MAG: hypothetical protein JSW23_07810 [Planctomycetota bacterium]|nr:MAG: hypothetical protein JSW23_07810 [Planctomycetota bacterium]